MCQVCSFLALGIDIVFEGSMLQHGDLQWVDTQHAFQVGIAHIFLFKFVVHRLDDVLGLMSIVRFKVHMQDGDIFEVFLSGSPAYHI